MATVSAGARISRRTVTRWLSLGFPVGRVILHLLATFESITTGLVMVQLEVADRLVAPPGGKVYGTPSAKLAWYASSARVGTVPPTVFWPAPNVDSALVAMERREPPSTTASREDVFTVVDAAFAQRRKTLRNALSALCAPAMMEEAGVDPGARGETLPVDAFVRLANLTVPSA